MEGPMANIETETQTVRKFYFRVNPGRGTVKGYWRDETRVFILPTPISTPAPTVAANTPAYATAAKTLLTPSPSPSPAPPPASSPSPASSPPPSLAPANRRKRSKSARVTRRSVGVKETSGLSCAIANAPRKRFRPYTPVPGEEEALYPSPPAKRFRPCTPVASDEASPTTISAIAPLSPHDWKCYKTKAAIYAQCRGYVAVLDEKRLAEAGRMWYERDLARQVKNLLEMFEVPWKEAEEAERRRGDLLDCVNIASSGGVTPAV